MEIYFYDINKMPYSQDAIKQMHDIASNQHGYIVISGQAGTGKSITLLGMALEISKTGKNICLLFSEKEAELYASPDVHVPIPGHWKSVIYQDTEESFQDALASISGNNNAIVLFGMDEKTIHAAIELALKKELVISLLDTPFVGIDVTYTLRGWGIKNDNILYSLNGIISQLLVPRLCQTCRKKQITDLSTTRLIYPEAKEPCELWTEVGCDECGHTGRKGRVAANEVLSVTDETRPLILQYLESNQYPVLPSTAHFSIMRSIREWAHEGLVGIETYKNDILSNPLLRGHHLMEAEHARAAHISDMFSRFVANEVVQQLISQEHLERFLEGEKRRVTCMFCDIRGSSILAEQIPPNELFRLINTYFGKLIEIVFKHEGTIDKFVGDGIMILFGAPLSQSDQEIRAVQCAIEIQKVVISLADKLSNTHHIHFGIGINTGDVIAGCLGNRERMDYTVLGDVVNTAARLESIAQPNQILIGPETHKAVAQHQDCRSLGSLNLKGKALPLDCYEVVFQ